MHLISIALVFFLITNPIGNAPGVLALIKDFDLKKQKFILLREAAIALCLALFFQYLGEIFLTELTVKNYSVSLSGGILLLIVALNMIFAPHQGPSESVKKEAPLIVPIATPLLAGPGLLTSIMLYSHIEPNNVILTSAILIAWIPITLILFISPYLLKLVGQRGMIALEQLMGLLLTMMSVEMILGGITAFNKIL